MKVKKAFVTGGAKRVGRAIVEFLASQGWSVLIHVNTSVKEGEELVLKLQVQYPDQDFSLACFNLIDWRPSSSFFEERITQFGKLDLLINNASSYEPGCISDLTDRHLETMYAIHCFSPFMISKVFKKHTTQGQIINILDAAIKKNDTSYSAYLLAKKSLADFTKMSALQWAPNFRVNAIAPGPVLPANVSDNTNFESVIESSPLKMQVGLDDIFNALNYLIEGKCITGQILFVDSGQHLL